jgi:serine protease Do
VATGESAEPALAGSKRGPATEAERNGLGVTIHALTRDLASQFGVQPADGVIVVGVEQGAPADRKGLRPGDIITSINQQNVANPKQFRDALKKADVKKGVIVNFTSGNAARFEVLKEEEP